MKRVIVEIERGLNKKTHPDADVKCFVTYVQDLPNGKGMYQINLRYPVDRHGAFTTHSQVFSTQQQRATKNVRL